MALTELQQQRVWVLWYGGEVRANYFADLAGRYRRRQTAATWAVLFSSSGAFLSLLAQRPAGYDWIPAALTLVTAGLSLYSVVARNQEHATECSGLQHRWGRLSAEGRALWDDMRAENASTRYAAMEEEATELSTRGNALPNKQRLIKKWDAHVARHHAAGRAA